MRLILPVSIAAVILSAIPFCLHAQQSKDSSVLKGSARFLTQDQIQTYWSYAAERLSDNDYRTAIATLYFLLNAEGLSAMQLEEVDQVLLQVLRASKRQIDPNEKRQPGVVIKPSLTTNSTAREVIRQEVPVVQFEQVSVVEVARVAEVPESSVGEAATELSISPIVNGNKDRSELSETNRNTNSNSDGSASVAPSGQDAGFAIIEAERPQQKVEVQTGVTEAEPISLQSATQEPGTYEDSGINSNEELTGGEGESENFEATDISIEISFSGEDYSNTAAELIDSEYSDLSSELSLSLYHFFSPVFSGYIEIELPLAESGSSVDTSESWMQFDLSNNLYWGDITLGTQSFSESRGWMFDSTLDLLSAGFSTDNWNLRLGVGEETQNSFWSDFFDPAGEADFRWAAEYSYKIREAHQLSFFLTGLKEDAADDDNTEADLSWVGLRAGGVFASNDESQFDYWADIGVVTGSEKNFEVVENAEGESFSQQLGETRIRGAAYDLGLTWWSNFPGSPQFTMAIAGTSGDSDLQDDTDKTYRQSGLHSNSADIGSASGLSYYGLALYPELSNIRIRSIGVVFPILSASYLSVLHYDYQQVSATTVLRNAALDLSLTGESKEIGEALDVVFSYEESEVWSASLSVGMFEAGKGSVQQSASAFYGLVDFSYNF